MWFSQAQDIVELQVKEHAGTRCRSFTAGALSAPARVIILCGARTSPCVGDKLQFQDELFWRESMNQRDTYAITIAGLERQLRLFEIKPGLRIAILNILGDTELVQACAGELAARLKDVRFDVLVTAEAKSIPLAHALSNELKKPYVVLRKTYKPYMGDALRAETLSITTGKAQLLVLDEKDRELLAGRNVVILDDVISTGSTLQGMRMLMERAGAKVAREAAILTEGERSQWEQIISLGHLPLFTD